MNSPFRLGVLLLVFLTSQSGFADHPNEGALVLDSLIAEALDRNLELQVAKSRLAAAQALEASSRSAFLPELSIEGGQLETKFSAERNSSTPVYGKLEWNLYRGGKDESTLKIRRTEAELARKQVDIFKAKIERDVARMYYEQQFFLEAISLKEKALAMNADQMKLAKAKNQSGFTSTADVIEFDLREATLRSDVKRLEQERSDQSRRMSVLIGREAPTGDLLVKGHLSRLKIKPDLNQVLSALSNSNPDLVEAQVQKELALREHQIVGGSYLPQVDIEGKYGKIATEERAIPDTNGYSAFLKVKIPLFSGMSTRHGRAATSARIMERDSNLSQKARVVHADATSLFAKFSSIQERLDLEERTLVRSEEYYKITLGEYRRGIKNSPDMVGASERLIDARIRNLELRKDLLLVHLDILALTGASGGK